MLSTKVLTTASGPNPWFKNDSVLANSLVAYWKLDEASGNRADSVGSSTLSDVNTVTSGAGVVYPLAAEFTIANSEFLNVLDSSTLSAGNIDMWGSCWCRPSAVNVSSCIMGKWNTSGNREWQIAQVNADVILQVSPDGTATGNAAVTATSALEADVWTFIMWYHDSVNNRIGLSINGGTFATASFSAGIFDSLSAFTIGRQGAAGATFFGGRIQNVALAKNYVPNQVDAVFLYNNERPRGVKSIKMLCMGGEVDWHPDGNKLVFDRKDNDGVYQLHVINHDGTNEVCISDPAVTGGPTVSRHKGFPAWHPNGEYIVSSVEMEVHNSEKYLSEPGRGHQCNMWVCTADGQDWWQLTNYSTTTSSGLLNPRFSHDGTKLFWARKIGGVSEPAPLGEWDLQIADFSLPGGVPTISNITTLVPGSGLFYESHGFSRDDTRIFFTSDAGLDNPYGLDVYSCDLDGSNLVNITNDPEEWDEHISFAVHTDKISFLSTRGTSYDAAAAQALVFLPESLANNLQGELVISNPDGTDRQVLTHFNTPGFPEYLVEDSVPTVVGWDPQGTRLAVAQLMLGANYDLASGRKIWMITFNGVYQ